MIYFNIKDIPSTTLNWTNYETVGLSSSSNLQVTIYGVRVSVIK